MSSVEPIPEQGHWADELVRQHAVTGAVVFAQRGGVDADGLTHLLALAEEHALNTLVGLAVRKRLFNVLVEGLENILHHTPREFAESAFALLVHGPEGYRFLFGNAAPQVAATMLVHRVEILNEMDEADLREHHLKVLANEGRTEHGGAGLGLLTMARKSTGPIVAHTLPRDKETAYVALELVLAAA